MPGSGVYKRQMATQAKQSRTQDSGRHHKYSITLTKV
jgi:hypothetical protein